MNGELYGQILRRRSFHYFKDVGDESLTAAELSDNSELVAVISAAIAAYEGTSQDGFVVRSIKRSRNNRW